MPAPTSSSKLKLKPERAELTVMPVSPLMCPASRPDRLLPMAVDRNQPPMARPTTRIGASLVTIDNPIGDRQSSPMVCST